METKHSELADAIAEFIEQIIEEHKSVNEEEKQNITQIVSAVRELINGVADGNENRVFRSLDIIRDTSSKVQNDLFKEVGKLTRKLHNSIAGFQHDIGPQLAHMAATDVPEAANQLQHVIAMTDSAANTVLELAEYQTKLLNEQKDAIMQLSTPDIQIKPPQLAQISEYNQQLTKTTTDIVMAQGFQDLSGQVLKRVITLISEVQDSLVDLVRMFGVADNAMNQEMPQSAVAKAAENQKSACNQDDIDSLLGSLGF